jgi:hypothetical protein
LKRGLTIAENLTTPSAKCSCSARCTCSIFASATSNLPCTTESAPVRLPRPLWLPPLSPCLTPLWGYHLQSAEQHLDWFISHAESHSLGPYIALGRGYRGKLAIRRGDPRSGVEALQQCLEELHAARYEVLAMTLNIALVQGLAALGRCDEGIALINETIRLVEANGSLTYLPELLRLKGSFAAQNLVKNRPLSTTLTNLITTGIQAWNQEQTWNPHRT